MNSILAGGYLALWILTLVWYQMKEHSFDGGSAVIMTYIVYATFSLLTILNPLFSTLFDPLRLFPYIYLYLMMMIALMPLISHHLHPADRIEEPSTRVLPLTAGIIIVSSILLLPDIIQNFGTGIVKLFTDTEAGKEAYMEQSSNAEDAGGSISNLPAVIYNMLSDLAVFLCFFYMTLGKKRIIMTALLFFSIIIGLLIPIMNGQRGGLIISFLTVIGGYMLFKRYLSKKINRIVSVLGIVMVIGVTLPIVAITMSRFGNKAAGVGGFVSWYVGQGSLYFNNSALEAGGTRHGDRTINLIKRVVYPDTPKNYSERRDKYRNLKIDDNIFSTFVGDFTSDFGPVTAAVIFVIFFFYVTMRIRPDNGTIKVHQLLLLYFALCISMQGGIALFSYSDTGNLRMFALLGLYAYLRYHEALLKKFPLKQTSDEQ